MKFKVEREIKRVKLYFADQQDLIARTSLLWDLDGKDGMFERNTDTNIWRLRQAATPAAKPAEPQPSQTPDNPKKKVRKTFRKFNMDGAVLRNEQDIDNYLANLKKSLMSLKDSCDEIEIV